MICILWGQIPVKPQTWKGAQFHLAARIRLRKPEADSSPARMSAERSDAFDRRDIDICKGQFLIYLYVCHENLFQARIIDLTDQHLREFLADTVRNALKTNS